MAALSGCKLAAGIRLVADVEFATLWQSVAHRRDDRWYAALPVRGSAFGRLPRTSKQTDWFSASGRDRAAAHERRKAWINCCRSALAATARRNRSKLLVAECFVPAAFLYQASTIPPPRVDLADVFTASAP